LNRVLQPGRAQRLQQPGDGRRMVETDALDGPGGQRPDRVVGPGGPQLFQQPGDLPRIVDVDLARRIAVEQGLNRLAGPGGAQFRQQIGGRLRIVDGHVRHGLGGQVPERLAGPGVMQRPRQLRDVPQGVEVLFRDPGGQGLDRRLGAGRVQCLEQLGDVLIEHEAGLPGGVAGQQDLDRIAGVGRRQYAQQPGGILSILEADLSRGAGR
jgi:hypothetical protein